MQNHFDKIDAGWIPEGHILAVFETPEGYYEAVLKQPSEGWEPGSAYVSPSNYPECGAFFGFYYGDDIGQFHETLADARERILFGLADLAEEQEEREIEKVPVYVILEDGFEQVVLRNFKPGNMYGALSGTFDKEQKGLVSFCSRENIFYTGILNSGTVVPVLGNNKTNSFWGAILRTRIYWEKIFNGSSCVRIFDAKGRRRVTRELPFGEFVEAESPSKERTSGSFAAAINEAEKKTSGRKKKRRRTLYWLDENADIKSEPVFEPVRTYSDGKQGFRWGKADNTEKHKSISVSPGRIAQWPEGWGFAAGTGAACHCRDRAHAFQLLTDLQRKLKAEQRAAKRIERERGEQSKPDYSYTFQRDAGTDWSTSIDWSRLEKDNPGTHPIVVEDEYAYATGQPPVAVLDRKLNKVFWYMTREDALRHGKHRYRVHPNLLNPEMGAMTS